MASTNNDNLKAFLLENAIPAEDVTYVASRRFVGADRKPIAWKLRILTSEESDKLLNQSKHKEFVPGTRDIKIVTDNEAFLAKLICASVTFPNLNDASLQDSYQAIGAEDLIHKMLTPGEYVDLASAVQEANGFEVGMQDKIERAKG